MYLAAMLLTICAGCATGRSGEAICDGTAASRAALAAALVADGGPQSRAAGRDLIARVDAGCLSPLDKGKLRGAFIFPSSDKP